MYIYKFKVPQTEFLSRWSQRTPLWFFFCFFCLEEWIRTGGGGGERAKVDKTGKKEEEQREEEGSREEGRKKNTGRKNNTAKKTAHEYTCICTQASADTEEKSIGVMLDEHLHF